MNVLPRELHVHKGDIGDDILKSEKGTRMNNKDESRSTNFTYGYI